MRRCRAAVRRPLRQIAVVLALLGIAGCGGTPPSRYYHMAAGPPEATSRQQAPLIVVDRVALAAYADRSPMVMRVGPTEVRFAEFDAWAEPVGQQIASVVADALGNRFGRAQVMTKSERLHRRADLLVDLEIVRFEIGMDNRALLDARWTLLEGGEEQIVATGREWIERMPLETDSFDARAQALSATLIDLAARIASAIEAAG